MAGKFREFVKKSTPLCASEISPGIGLAPPPTSATGRQYGAESGKDA